MSAEIPTVENPGSFNNYLETHEGGSIDDYLARVDKFHAFVTRQELKITDSDLLNGATTQASEESQAA